MGWLAKARMSLASPTRVQSWRRELPVSEWVTSGRLSAALMTVLVPGLRRSSGAAESIHS
jgi:hypothetical protein